jgi:hypothetical protein
MAVYEALLLNTVVPQIQAAQAGDSYVMVVNATTPALRITQTGTGDSILVEDAANPDSTPFVVTAGGDVGIGTSSPTQKLTLVNNAASTFLNTTDNTVNTLYGTSTGLSAGLLGTLTNHPLVFYANNGEKMRLDSSGNLGLGVTPSAWGSGITAFQLAKDTSVSSHTTGGNIFINSNTYYDGSNWIYSATRAASQYQQNNGLHVWYTAASGTAGNAISFTQAMTLDADGDLGIGTTSPSHRLHVVGNALVTPTGGWTTGGVATQYFGDIYGSIKYDYNTTNFLISSYGTFAIATNGASPTERARITSGGDLLVGTNTALNGTARLDVNALTGNNVAATLKNDAGANQWAAQVWNAGTSGDNSFIQFATETAYTGRGSITYNRGGGLVAYNTTSDYRAKDVTGPVANSGATIDALKVYNGKIKGATVERPMLIAHEAQEVTPYAVTGEKDAVEEDGKPKYQQMDVSSLVPLLIAEIQSLRARVAQLESKGP